MIRFFDILLSLIGLVVTLPILLIVTILGYFETGSPIFIQERMGKNKKYFKLIKFRTMSIDTKSVASHLVGTSSITKSGAFLRKTKIDELPQLINVLKGDMSLVGPRPNLPNQEDVIAARDKYNVYRALPGITGLAQVKEIDMSMPELLGKTDNEMLENLNIRSYFNYIIMTALGRGAGDRAR